MAATELSRFQDRHKDLDPNVTTHIALLASLGIKDRSNFLDFSEWDDDRKKIGLEQIFYTSKGIDAGLIDGYAGPQTEYAREVYKQRPTNPKAETWRDPPPKSLWQRATEWIRGPTVSGATTSPKPPTSPPPKSEPQIVVVPPVRPSTVRVFPTQAQVPAYYGERGANQVSCKVPFPMVIAWNTKQIVHAYSCHKLVKEPMEAIWHKTLEHYGLDNIQRLRLNYFGGCLNVRKMRGGSAWSMHSWGIAVDIDPERNALKMNSKQATMAKPEYDKFWEIVYSEGAISLGKERDYDWMHFQFARL